MMDVSAMELAMLRNMIIKTGKPLKKWIEIVKEQNLFFGIHKKDHDKLPLLEPNLKFTYRYIDLKNYSKNKKLVSEWSIIDDNYNLKRTYQIL